MPMPFLPVVSCGWTNCTNMGRIGLNEEGVPPNRATGTIPSNPGSRLVE